MPQELNKTTDENGNPVESVRVKAIEHPTASWSPNSQLVLENSSRPEQDAFKEKRERRKQKKQQQEAKMIKAESIPGFRGDLELGDILKYIDGNKSKKANKKKQTGVQDNGLPEKYKVKKAANAKTQSKSLEDKCSEDSSERGDDASSKTSDLGEDKAKDVCDLPDVGVRVNDSGSEGSISSDLNKDIASAEAKLDSSINADNKIEADDVSSGGESNPTGPSVDALSASLVSDYIFTDYDSVSSPKEADFVTVSTKKKKVRSSAQPGNQHYQYKDNSYGGGGGGGYYYNHRESSSNPGDSRSPGFGMHSAQLAVRGEDRRPARPPRTYARSVTPPPATLSSSLVTQDGVHDSSHYTYNKTRERAFSPTSIPFEKKRSEDEGEFPVMTEQSNDFPRLPTSSPHEGRRNSTGNVPSEVNIDADSDMESVKSLPLASTARKDGGSSPRDSVTSNIISYARIAAGSRGGGSGASVTKTMSMSNSTSTASVNSVPSSTVSSSNQNSSGATGADVTRPDEGYVTTDHTADSGLSNTVSASSSKSDELSSLSGSEQPVKADAGQLTCKSPELPVDSSSATPQKPEPVKSPEPEPRTEAAAVRKVSSSSIHSESSCGSGTSKNHKAEIDKVQTVINDKDDAKASSPVRCGSEVPSDSHATTKSVCSVGKRTAKTKSSVVFMDKKMGAPSEKIEISFGFDDDADKRSQEARVSPQLCDNVQGMQFGAATLVYPTEGFVPGISPVPPHTRCGVKGPMAGMNGVIPSAEMMAYPPPHALGVPVNMAHPPPAHLMHPPPVPFTSGHMMSLPSMAPPVTQFVAVPHAGVPRSPLMAPVPQRQHQHRPLAPVESPVMFGGGSSTPEQPENKTPQQPPQPQPQQKETVTEAAHQEPPTDVSSEADFPPLSAATSGNKRSSSSPATSTPTATIESKGDYASTTSVGSKSPQLTEPPDPQAPQAADQLEAPVDDDDDDDIQRLPMFFPEPDQDPNFDCGNFNQDDAVLYLQRGEFCSQQ